MRAPAATASVPPTGVRPAPGELLVPVALAAVVAGLVVPLPAALLDLLLATSIALGVLVLLVAVWAEAPHELTALPAVMLPSILFGLALDGAATRTILVRPEAAGHVISTVGAFFTGGSDALAAMAATVLLVLDVAVILASTRRVVRAAGRARGRATAGEVEFWGALVGAARLVRGAAIAGLAMAAVDLVGGCALAVDEAGVDWLARARTSAGLAIGNGLVSQIPALFLATAASVVATRAAARVEPLTDAGELASTLPLWAVSGILIVLGSLPGLPFLPFVALAGAAGALAASGGRESPGDDTADRAAVDDVPPLDVLGLELGVALVPLVDGATGRVPDGGADLVARIRRLRREIAGELGIVVPPIRVRDDPSLPPRAYRVRLKGAEVVRGELASDGVLDPAHALVAHVGEVVRRHAHELLGRQEVQGLLDGLARSRPKAVDEVMPVLLTLGGVQRVLQNLLGERVSIRDLATILETLAEHAGHTKDPVVLTEHVRRALGRAITERLLAADGTLVVVTLDPPLEQALGDALAPGEECDARALDPATAERLVRRLAEWTARLVAEGAPPVLVCSPRLRPWLRRFLEVHLPELAVLAPSEARLAARVRAFGVVTLDHA